MSEVPCASPHPKSPPNDEETLQDLSAKQRQQLESYVDTLLVANAQFNLTAVRNKEDAWERHVVESLRLTPLLGSPSNLLDVGTGGGLPGMVLAIARPNIKFSLLEATEKKVHFLEETSKSLGLQNVRVIRARAEDAAKPGSELREHFDLVTARAVAPLRTLLEITIPFLKRGGTLMAVKGMRAEEELRAATRAMKLLHCTLSENIRQPSATVLLIEKNDRTSTKYPRRSGEPKHNPL